MSATDDSTGAIGVITTIEHVDGQMLEMRDVDADVRSEWIDHLEARLAALDGVEEAWGAGNRHTNCQTGQFELTLAHTTPRWRDGVELETNLRSFAQRLRQVFEDSHYVSTHEVTLKPESLGDGRHDSPSYVVEFDLR